MSAENSVWRVSTDELNAFVASIMVRVGMAPGGAAIVADNLVAADLAGMHSHGVMRVPWYVSGLQKGAVNPRPTLRRTSQRRYAGALDGDNGMGQVIAVRGMEWALEMTHNEGIGMVGVQHSNHFGAAAHFARMAAIEGYIGAAMTNGYPNMAAWGGTQRMLGNHPLDVAIPSGEAPPVVLDIASSVAAQGKIALAAKKGESIPLGWALDENGQPNQDSQQAVDGLLMPLGGHKGYGMSLVILVMSAVLTGATMSWEMPSLQTGQRGLGNDVGHFLMAIDVENLCPLAVFKQRMDEAIAALKACPRADGVDSIYVPGELEFLKEKAYRAEGIPMAEAVMQELRELVSRLDVGFPWSQGGC